jgi:hypothetical protein
MIGVDDLQFLVASSGLIKTETDALNGLMPTGVTRLPTPPAVTAQATGTTTGTTTGTNTGAQVVVPAGLTFSAKMNFGGSPSALSLAVAGGAQTGGTNAQTAPPPATTGTTSNAAGNARWFPLQKAFGPVYFEKVGVQYQDGVISFLLSASLSIAGLTLSLDGLSVGSPVKDFDPRFDLRGLGIDYKGGGAVEIGGAFLRIPKEISGKSYDEYDGAAIIKSENLTLSALGSYAELDGHPSLFIYAVLDYPIGGPSFFFVTGLAAGFGYNRALLIPPIEQVAQFPLVADAISGAAMPKDLGQKLAAIQRYIPPSAGDYFLAVGIKFTSFKLIDSFALLTVSFGTQFEVNLLGLSTLIVPTPIPGQTAITPLAEVQMAVKATFNPDQGFLGVSAQLTAASFLLSRNCQLTGGFAFYTWFAGEHKGDFVVTLGGYHPDYKVPAHYPAVPRLSFNWRVNNQLTIKGGAYYALTATALMAGGNLQATWEDGSLKARFNAGADFIIYWQPYHYDAKAHVEISVSYTYHFFGTHHLNVDVGADLHLWGPEFTGTAHVKLDIISFDINFGDSSRQKPGAIDWDTFQKAFLPKNKEGQLDICGINIQNGLVKAPDADDNSSSTPVDWVINPKNFSLVTNSVIPSKQAFQGTQQVALTEDVNGAFGIGSMAVSASEFSSKQTISITRYDDLAGKDEHVEDDFDFIPVLKKVPVGLWGQTLTPPLNGQAFVEQTLAGFEIRPKNQPAPGMTASVQRSYLQFDTTPVPDAYAWESQAPFVATELDREQAIEVISDSLSNDATIAAREELLNALGVSALINLSGAAATAFLIQPQIEAV